MEKTNELVTYITIALNFHGKRHLVEGVKIVWFRTAINLLDYLRICKFE